MEYLPSASGTARQAARILNLLLAGRPLQAEPEESAGACPVESRSGLEEERRELLDGLVENLRQPGAAGRAEVYLQLLGHLAFAPKEGLARCRAGAGGPNPVTARVRPLGRPSCGRR